MSFKLWCVLKVKKCIIIILRVLQFDTTEWHTEARFGKGVHTMAVAGPGGGGQVPSFKKHLKQVDVVLLLKTMHRAAS